MELLTVSEAASMLNLKVGRVRAAIFRREIPYIKIGALVRLNRTELIKWLDGHTILPRRGTEC